MIVTGNTSWLELIWTASMGIALIALLVSAGIVINKYRIYRRRDPHTGKRGNGAGVWLFWKDILMYALLIFVTGIFTWVGVVAMGTPEPIRDQNQESGRTVAIIFIGVAVGTALYALLNLWMGFQIEREIMNEGKIKRSKIRWRRPKSILTVTSEEVAHPSEDDREMTAVTETDEDDRKC